MKRLLLPMILVLAGCSPSQDSSDATSETTPDTAPAAATSAPTSTHQNPPPAVLEVAPPGEQPSSTPPPSKAVAATLRIVFNSDAGEAYYFHQAIDLDGDGRDEIIAHVVGPDVCGSEGCDTVVLTPDGNGYRIVADIASTRPPISVAATRSNHWRDLVVTTGGAGGGSRPVLLQYDGTTYPSNPALARGKRLSATPDGAELLIKPFESFTDGAPLGNRE